MVLATSASRSSIPLEPLSFASTRRRRASPSRAPIFQRRQPGPFNPNMRAHQIVRREAARGPLVLKPLFGAQGFGLKLIRREEDLPPFHEVEGVYYLQRFVAVERNGFRDMRLFVSHGEVIAAMTRHSKHWITNVKLGARPEWLEPDDLMIDLALRSSAAVGADFAGVDIILDADNAPQVLEVNSMRAGEDCRK